MIYFFNFYSYHSQLLQSPLASKSQWAKNSTAHWQVPITVQNVWISGIINSVKLIAQEISELAGDFLNSDLHWEENKNPCYFN